MALPSIKSLSVPALLSLRQDIDRTLQSKRSELEAQLRQIGNDGARAVKTRGGPKGGKVAPKYRHPTSGETWTGRGGVAGWLAQEIKSGKKREDFLISKPVGKRAAKKKK